MSQISEYAAVVAETIRSLSQSMRLWRLIVTLGALFLLGGTMSLIVDHFNGYFYFDRFNRKIDAIERLEAKSKNPEFVLRMEQSYLDAANDLKNYELNRSFEFRSVGRTSTTGEKVVFLLISLLWPIAIVIVQYNHVDNRKNIVGAAMVFIFNAGMAWFIPIVYSWLFSGYILYLGQTALLIWLSRLFQQSGSNTEIALPFD